MVPGRSASMQVVVTAAIDGRVPDAAPGSRNVLLWEYVSRHVHARTHACTWGLNGVEEQRGKERKKCKREWIVKRGAGRGYGWFNSTYSDAPCQAIFVS